MRRPFASDIKDWNRLFYQTKLKQIERFVLFPVANNLQLHIFKRNIEIFRIFASSKLCSLNSPNSWNNRENRFEEHFPANINIIFDHFAISGLLANFYDPILGEKKFLVRSWTNFSGTSSWWGSDPNLLLYLFRYTFPPATNSQGLYNFALRRSSLLRFCRGDAISIDTTGESC